MVPRRVGVSQCVLSSVAVVVCGGGLLALAG